MLMNGSYASGARQRLRWWWCSKVWDWFSEEDEKKKKNEIIYGINKSVFDEHNKLKGVSLKPSELKHSSCIDHYQSVTMDAPSVRCTEYSVCHVFRFSHCPWELPSIIVLPCPILSSSHCVCVKKLVPLLGQGAGMPGWKTPGESAFWTPLVRLVWCSASLCCWVSLSSTPGGLLLQTHPTTNFEPPHPP